MCGRYTLTASADRLAKQFGTSGDQPQLTPSYNVAPSQQVAAALEEGGRRRLEMLRWGLVPSWADDPEIGNRMINARAETAPEKPSFRSAFKSRRCLIAADGFYEWRKTDDGKQPHHIRMKDGSPFGFAGLWEVWKKDGEVRSCAILTTDASPMLSDIHNRMPVIIPPEAYDLWLDPDVNDIERLKDLLVPYDDELLEAYPVSRHVNRPANDDARCVEPVA